MEPLQLGERDMVGQPPEEGFRGVRRCSRNARVPRRRYILLARHYPSGSLRIETERVAQEYILSLDDRRATLESVGGKGVSLSRLLRASMPVPCGFHVTTAAYDRFVAESYLQSGIRAALEIVDTSKPDTLTNASEKIEDLFLRADMSKEISGAISQAYAGLDQEEPAVAVRSSATAEDLPSASFAGQQASLLNVRGEDELLEAVRRCWASLWSARAIAYREREGIDQQTVKLAVVVQRMVPAEVAGVLFSANPVTGARDEVVIDASPGLGEAVVSGLVTPDHFVLQKRWWGWSIIKRQPGRRQVIVRARPGGSTERIEGSSATDIPELPDRALRGLARLGIAIERHFGVPQDVEWAWASGRLFILQARAITVLPEPAPNLNRIERRMAALFAEMLPIRPYPLDMTTWGPALFKAVASTFTPIGLAFPRFEQQFVEEEGVVVRFSGRLPRPTPSVVLAPVRLLRLTRRYNPLHWREDPLLADTQLRARGLEARELRELSWEGLLATVHETLELPLPLAGEIRRRYFPRAALAAGLLYLGLRLTGRAQGFGTLLSGVENKTLEANSALEKQPPGQPFVDELRICLDRYGHRQQVIFVVLEATWKDAPEVVLGILKGLAQAKPRPQTGRPTWETVRDEVLRHPLLQISPLRSAFLKLLAEARCFLQIREDTHFYATLALPVLRRTLLEFGRRLASVGMLGSSKDVFHLKLGELERIDRTWPPRLAEQLQAVVLRRKERRAALEGTPLIDPRLFRRTEPEGDALLHGTPGSPGVAEGPIRIIRGSSEFGKLRSGEVLVAPYTNPAWTPLFQRAAAVVVDSGGAASHAAIVAREYGIPAVMGTIEGTHSLLDGEQVRVDGTRGLVYRAAQRTKAYEVQQQSR